MAILEALARNAESSAAQLAKEFQMSYMGARSQCLALEKSGYLSSRLQAVEGRGRPEIMYSLTPRSRNIFPQAGVPLIASLLGHAERLFGRQAPAKLLFLHFKELGDRYVRELEGLPAAERPAALAQIRSADGYVSAFDPGPPPALIEGHSPLAALQKEYPETIATETEVIGRALGGRVTRETSRGGRVIYRLEGD